MADNFFLGAADDVKQVDTITVLDTWATGDTASIICNNKTVTVTVGSSVTPTDVAAALAAAINAIDAVTDIVNDETRNRGGRELGEFRDIDASSNAAVLTLKSSTAGWPFVVTHSIDVPVGDGTLGAVTSVTVATGKNHFNNSANWSKTLESDDELILNAGNISILHNLDNVVERLNLTKRNGFTGDIGLPVINERHRGYPYAEYRQPYLDMPATDGSGSQTIEIGDQISSIAASGIMKLDLKAVSGTSLTVILYDSPAWSTTNKHGVQIVGGKSITAYTYKGSMSIGDDKSATASEVGNLQVNGTASVSPQILIGDNALWTDTPTKMEQSSGDVTLLVGDADMDIDMRGGTLKLGVGTVFGTIEIFGGTVHPLGSAATTVNIYNGGALDCYGASVFTVTNITCYRGFKYQDPDGIVEMSVAGIDFIGCTPTDGTFKVRDHQTWTPTAI